MIFYRYSRGALLAVTVLIPCVGAAQTTERDPLNPRTATSSAPYQSAFTDYKNYQEPELIPWPGANNVVREFGGMAGMKGREDMNSTDLTKVGKDGMKGMDETVNKPDGPQHDMGKMNGKTMPAPPKKPVSSDGKPSEMANMPGHDMSKMKGSSNANIRVTPEPARKDMKGRKGSDEMKDMPGHDMGSMKEKAAPVPASKPAPSAAKPAAPAPKTMPDHSGMK